MPPEDVYRRSVTASNTSWQSSAVQFGRFETFLCGRELDGFRSWNASDYPAIFMDCHMPEMDGYEATRQIRSREVAEARVRTPIIALTANVFDRDRDREACLRAGMDEFLEKPITINQLHEVLERILATRPAPSKIENRAVVAT